MFSTVKVCGLEKDESVQIQENNIWIKISNIALFENYPKLLVVLDLDAEEKIILYLLGKVFYVLSFLLSMLMTFFW